MPVYDFSCQECGERFEALVALGERSACPSCGAPDARRLITSFQGPLTIQPRGREAKRMEGARRAREEKRREQRARRRSR